MQRFDYVIDGSNIARLSTDGRTQRMADLRLVLVVCREIAWNGHSFRCYFDANISSLVLDIDRTLLDVMLGVHNHHFVLSRRRKQADPYLLNLAKSFSAVAVSHDHFRDHVTKHPWLKTQGRHICPQVESGLLNCPYLGAFDFQEKSSSEYYEDLLPFLDLA